MSEPDPAYRFDFYERVRIVGEDPSLDEVRGELGAVLGRADEGLGEPAYAVLVYATGLCWSVNESALEPTGEHDRRESFYDDTQPSLRVSPDGEFRGFNEPRPPTTE